MKIPFAINAALFLVALTFAHGSARASNDGRFSAGGYHACQIHEDQSLSCWGLNREGQTNVPPGSYKYVSAGAFHTCAIKASGEIACWGHNEYGQTNVPATSDKFQEVSAGGFHSCALTEDTFPRVRCWGRNIEGQAEFTQLGFFSRISAGSWSTCAIRMPTTIPEGDPVPFGPLHCWGENNGSMAFPTDPFYSHYMRVAVGSRNGCAILHFEEPNGNNIHCWGAFPSTDGLYGETNPPPGYFTEIATGDFFNVCALSVDGSIECWGNNEFGQSIAPDGKTFARITTGRDYACAMRTDGTTVCWGRNVYGAAPRPSLVPTTLASATVGAGYSAGVGMFDGTETDTIYGYHPEQQTFRLVDGTLPSGLQLSEGGGISGFPSSTGTYAFTITGRDRNGFEASREYSITVAPDSTPPPKPSPSQAVQSVVMYFASLDMPPAQGESLHTLLINSLRNSSEPDLRLAQACQMMNVFVDQVSVRQRAGKLDLTHATQLLLRGEAALDDMGCS